MCVVSMVHDDWNKRWPEIQPPDTTTIFTPWPPEVTKEEFKALKKEVKALKKLLKAAKIYDEETGQPDCAIDEKTKALKKIAKWLDVDMSDIY